MKIAIYSNDVLKSQKVTKKLAEDIKKAPGLTIDQEHPKIVISVGGDGTLLSAFHYYFDQIDTIRFIGIHTGHLGFYTDWRGDQVDELVKALESDNGESVSYPLLQTKVEYTDDVEPTYLTALNETTLKKLEGTMVAKVYVKGELFENFRGDGLCISTPTGSTAYNKAVGGAIICPQFNSIQMAEMASINNRVFRTIGSPIIISEGETLEVVPEVSLNNMVTCDELSIMDRPIKKLSFSVSKKRICFARYKHTDFWKRVSESFIGQPTDD